jgi:predicted XRE-type DNA-binding protein
MSKKRTLDGFKKSSGNIFADLGVENPEVHRIKADLALRLNKLIDQEGCSQSELAGRLGLQQPHVSQLRNYRLKGFSVERLMELIVKLGVPIDIQIGAFPCANAQLCVVNRSPTQLVVISDSFADDHSAWKDMGAERSGVRSSTSGPSRESSGFEPLKTYHIGSQKSQWRTLQ